MEDVWAFDSGSATAALAGNSKGNKKSQGALRTRKKLADISNIPQQPILFIQNDMEQLKKEKMELVKLLADKNKIIELDGVELQKLRANMQKLQLQNMHLAQSNSHMLAEVNAYKDRLKAVFHELGCRNGLVQALRSELQAKVENRTCEENGKEVGGSEPVVREQRSLEAETENKNTHRRQRSTSLGPTATQVHQGKENKRRRQSARFIREEAEVVVGVGCSLKQIGEEGNPSSSSSEGKRLRPSREAAKKVQSYKEVSLNLKMRRPS